MSWRGLGFGLALCAALGIVLVRECSPPREPLGGSPPSTADEDKQHASPGDLRTGEGNDEDDAKTERLPVAHDLAAGLDPGSENLRELEGLRPQLDPDPLADPSGFLLRELERFEVVHRDDLPRILTADKCALSSSVNPKRHQLTDVQRRHLESILERDNARIREIRSDMSQREIAAFRDAIRRGSYAAWHHVAGTGGFRVTDLLEEAKSRTGLTDEDLHYRYVSCGGKASYCVYFTRADDPEFFRLLDLGRPLLREQISDVKRFFAGL